MHPRLHTQAPTTLRLALAAITLLISAITIQAETSTTADPETPAPLISAAHQHHAWYVTTGALSPFALYHTTPTEDGSLRTRLTAPLNQPPTHIAASENHVLLLFNQTDDADQGEQRRYILRSTRATPLTNATHAFPKLSPRPPLSTKGEVHTTALLTPDTAIALSNDNGRTALHVLHASTWHTVSDPRLPNPDPATRIVAMPTTNATSPAALLITPPSPDRPSDRAHAKLTIDLAAHPLPPAISITPIPLPHVHAAAVIHTPEGLTTIAPSDDGRTLTRAILRGNTAIPRFESTLAPPLTPLDRVHALAEHTLILRPPTTPSTNEPATNTPTINATLLATDGTTTFDGPLRTQPPLPPQQLHLTLLVLASAILTTSLYILRSDADLRRPVTLPPNTAIAPPTRRILATTLDLFIAITVAATLSGEPLAWLTQPVGTLLEDHGITPILATIATAIALSTITETTIGATPGKLLTRTRTTNRHARRPSPLEALARNTAKYTCPALISFVLTEPHRPFPGSRSTYVTTRVQQPDEPDNTPPTHNEQPGNEDKPNQHQ